MWDGKRPGGGQADMDSGTEETLSQGRILYKPV